MNAQQSNVDLIDCLKALLAGDYAALPVDGDEVSELVRALAQKLCANTIDEMGRVVNVSVQVNETAIYSAHLLADFRKVDSKAQTIAAAAEEMVATVKSIGSYGANISKQANEAETLVKAGSQVAQRAIGGMKKITSSVRDSADKVNVLADFSKRISSISADIKKIADQTNLLALNATIEAARAGEAGRGFAVVAGEVKNLSGQTRKATEEINDIIHRLQEEMQAVLSSMRESSNAVASGEKAIIELGNHIDEIDKKIDDVNRNTAQISSTLAEQAQASQEVAVGITDIAANSKHSVEGIEKIVNSMDMVEKLINVQLGKLAELNVPDKIIKLAQSDHVLWKKRLVNMIIGKEGLNPSELADHHNCRLGKWYETVENAKYTNNTVFQKLAVPHRLVHEHGIQAVRFFNDGKLDQALAEISKVESASKDVLKLLAALEGK
jgi:methyl-accepting chemotaxis protein